MSSNQVYFITGANRGLGLGLAKAYAARPDIILFVTARDPSKATELNELAASNKNVHVLRLAADSEADAAAAAQEVSRLTGGVDVVIGNAGIMNHSGTGLTTPISAVEEHYRVNTLGPLILFQALYPLLKERQTRKFVAISSGAASITDIVPLPILAYGASKAATNFIARRLHSEHLAEGFVIFALSPGWVKTEMGNRGAAAAGMAEAPLTIEESIAGQVKVIDNAGENESGRFLSYDGTEYKW
jgi:norsolorinic acid ketoreductase